MSKLEEFAPNLYLVEGGTVSFHGFPYPTRAAIVRLAQDLLWVWSPVGLDEDLAAAVDDLGSVRYLISPNKIHHLFLADWARRWPDAELFASPGLEARRPDLHFRGTLDDAAEPAWSAEIDQVVFRGSFAMEEVVFLHRPSRTALVCDLIQRHDPRSQHGWRGALMRLDGLVGEAGSTPRACNASCPCAGTRLAGRAPRDRTWRVRAP